MTNTMCESCVELETDDPGKAQKALLKMVFQTDRLTCTICEHKIDLSTKAVSGEAWGS